MHTIYFLFDWYVIHMYYRGNAEKSISVQSNMSIVTLTFYAKGIIFSSRAIMCHKFGQDILVWSLWCPQGYFYICRLWAWLLTSDLGNAWPCQWSRSQSTNIKSIGNILSWTICEPIWSVLFLLCSHAYFHIYSLWSVNWPRKSLGYKVMMCRTDKLIHGTNTTYSLCNLLHGNS